MKAMLTFSLCVLLLAACGTPAQGRSPVTQAAPTATSTPEAVPTSAPSATPSAQIFPSATPSPTPIDTGTLPSPTAQSSEGCTDKAAFSEDVTIPDGTTVEIGETFTKTWRVRNVGTCTWSGYQLVYAGGEAMNGSMSNTMPEIQPDAYGDISVNLQALQPGGGFTGYWIFKNAAGGTFGVGAEGEGQHWVQINVGYPLPPGGTPVAADTTPVVTGTTPAAASTPHTSQSGCVYSRNSDYEAQILSLINNVRTQNGLGTLTLDNRLSAAALAHSLDMACDNIISHTGTDGSTWYDRVKAQGFASYHSARENIYVGNPAFGGDAQGAFTWWMNSTIHRKTLMSPDATLIGIAYVYSDASTYGGNYTTVFARP